MLLKDVVSSLPRLVLSGSRITFSELNILQRMRSLDKLPLNKIILYTPTNLFRPVVWGLRQIGQQCFLICWGAEGGGSDDFFFRFEAKIL